MPTNDVVEWKTLEIWRLLCLTVLKKKSEPSLKYGHPML